MMRGTGVDHLDLVVSDLERSLNFYRQLLEPPGYFCTNYGRVTPLVTIFRVLKTRGAGGVQEVLGAEVWGTIGTDRYAGYHWIAPCQRQLCWAHLKREFVAWSEHAGETSRIGLALLVVEKQLFELWYRVRDGTLAWADFQVAMLPLMARVRTLLQEGVAGADTKAQGTCRNLLKREAALWTFVRVDGVEPTNNAAERALRPAAGSRPCSVRCSRQDDLPGDGAEGDGRS